MVSTHRHLDSQELYYLANKENYVTEVVFRPQDQPAKITVWHHATGKRTTLKKRVDNSYRLRLNPVESVCITYAVEDVPGVENAKASAPDYQTYGSLATTSFVILTKNCLDFALLFVTLPIIKIYDYEKNAFLPHGNGLCADAFSAEYL